MKKKESSHDILAALDLGSNSFHLVVAKRTDSGFRIVDKHKETVRLASGLDVHGSLKKESIKKALNCISRLSERIRDLPTRGVRIVGTNTLRKAKNSEAFIIEAEKIIGHPIDIISGTEEARLIYLGVTKDIGFVDSKTLVIDIGGGSTEIIIGKNSEPLMLSSLHMGCISQTLKFFQAGNLDIEVFNQAMVAVAQELEPISLSYRDYGWNKVLGSSGTIISIYEILEKNGWAKEIITKEGLENLLNRLLSAGSIKKLSIKGVSDDRKDILPGGLAILMGIFKAMKLDTMSVSYNALREGLLFDLVGRIDNKDVRDSTVSALQRDYQIDTWHASVVERSVIHIFDSLQEDWSIFNNDYRKLIGWAAQLAEIGLIVSYSQYHKHGAYLLANLDMPGFSEKEKNILSFLVRAQRRKFPAREFRMMGRVEKKVLCKLSIMLRVAILLHRSRMDFPIEKCQLLFTDDTFEITFPKLWMKDHLLTLADLKSEQDYLKAIGYTLLFND